MTTTPTPHQPLPAGSDPDPIERVVVGVDGSAGSLGALRWALQEAHAHQVGIHAVLAYDYHRTWNDAGLGSMFPVNYGVGATQASPDVSDPAASGVLEAENAARNILDEAVASAVATMSPATLDGVKVTQDVVEGHPAQVLLDAAAHHDLLVVGSRGHGQFANALLGSISQHVVTHARTAVVVIPPDDVD